MFFGGQQLAPDIVKKVDLFVGLGPVADLTDPFDNELGFLRFLATILEDGEDKLFDFLGDEQFLPQFGFVSPILQKVLDMFCKMEGIGCDSLIEILVGRHKGSFNDSRMEVVVAHEPGGSSVRNIEHWTQVRVRLLIFLFSLAACFVFLCARRHLQAPARRYRRLRLRSLVADSLWRPALTPMPTGDCVIAVLPG